MRAALRMSVQDLPTDQAVHAGDGRERTQKEPGSSDMREAVPGPEAAVPLRDNYDAFAVTAAMPNFAAPSVWLRRCP